MYRSTIRRPTVGEVRNLHVRVGPRRGMDSSSRPRRRACLFVGVRWQRHTVAGQDRLLQDELNLAVHAAQFLLRPALERFIQRGIQSQQE